MRTDDVTRRAALRWLGRAAVLAGLATVAGGVVAQAEPSETPLRHEPRPLAFGDDRCPACGMAVIDGRFAAQARTEGGRTLVYDAIECLADHLNGHAGEVPVVVADWLADRVASTREVAAWLPAEEAAVLHHPRLRTPMGGGLAAFTDLHDLRAFAEAQRLAEPTVLAWDEVLELGEARPWVPVL